MAASGASHLLGLARASQDQSAGRGRVVAPSDCNVGLRSGEKRKSVKTAGVVRCDAFGDMLRSALVELSSSE